MSASVLIAAMEAGKTVQKVVNPGCSKPQVVTLRFVWWDAGRQRVVSVNSNYPLRPSSRSNYRVWLAEMIERPEEWGVVEEAAPEKQEAAQ
jgi:hypothetical protein